MGYASEECGDLRPSTPCGDGPAKRRGVAWLVLRAHGRRTPEFIIFSGRGRCSFHVRNRGPIQATPKSKGTSKLGRTIVTGARSTDAVEPARVPFQRRGNQQAWKEHFYVMALQDDERRSSLWCNKWQMGFSSLKRQQPGRIVRKYSGTEHSG